MTTTLDHDASQASTTENEPKPRSLSNLAVRLITGITLIPLILIVILWGGWPFLIVVSLIAILATLEFYFMERQRGLHNNGIIGIAAAIAVILAFQMHEARLWQGALLGSVVITLALEFARSREMQRSLIRVGTTLWGTLYIVFPLAFLVEIRQIQPFGIHWIFVIIYSTWCTDTFSYLIGNMFGKTKLAPRLSPGKTVEGAIGGVIGGAICAILVLIRIDELTTIAAIVLGFAPIVGIAGDLFESGLKRYFGVKDSHLPGFNVFPGHGGVLDRIDSLVWITTFIYAHLLLSGQIDVLI